MLRGITLILLLLARLGVSAQTCAILSDATVCKDELIAFSISTTKTVSTVHWNFGDGSTGNQQSVSHAYSTAGSKTVTLSLTFSDGSSCSTSKQITVHDLPTASFVLNAKSFCFNDHEVCLTDNSSMGSTTSGYGNRLVIWGDGGVDPNSSPSVGDRICYSSYGAWSSIPYTITVEVQNDQGCEDQWQEQVRINKGYIPAFTASTQTADCNSQRVCFANDSTLQDTSIASFQWDFGDTTYNTTHWANICHDYNKPGTYTARLRVTLKNGCTAEVEQTVEISFLDLDVEVTVDDTVLCFPQPFNLSGSKQPNVRYNWELADTNGVVFDMVSRFRNFQLVPPAPGEYLIRLKTFAGNCKQYTEFVRISSRGVDLQFTPLNRHQCEVRDTVYFYNTSIEHLTARPQYTWEFLDPNSTANCTGWRSNCDRDHDFHSRHWYSDTGCYYPRLMYYDSTSGCRDTLQAQVALQDIRSAQVTATLDKACYGDKLDYTVRFAHNVCAGKVLAQYDSCSIWEPFAGAVLYDTVCDPDGWISASFQFIIGDSVIFRSADPSDYYIDQRRICWDTIRYRQWFQLTPEPSMDFAIDKDGCLPVDLSIRYTGTEEGKLSRIGVSWGGEVNSYDIMDSVPTLSHRFEEEGSVPVIVFLEDSFGCYDVVDHTLYFGFHNDFEMDSIHCAGEPLLLKDTIAYYHSTRSFWREIGRPEQLYWDLDTGSGFDSLGFEPMVQLDRRGTYSVRMRTVDSTGCADTVTHKVHIVGVNAGIRSDTSFSCNQVVQFLDSSYLDYVEGGDSITSYYWAFGDGSVHSVLKDPYHYYNQNGLLNIIHAVGSEAGCKDTVEFSIFIDGPEPWFDIISDSIGCAPFTVRLRSNSHKVSNWVWHLGDTSKNTISTQADTTLIYTYKQPGVYEIYLEGADSFYNPKANNHYTCKSSYPDTNALKPILKRVHVLPIPEVGIMTQSPICVGQLVPIWSVSHPRYTDFYWDIDGLQPAPPNADTIYHRFDTAGIYRVRLNPTYVPASIYERECFDSSSLDLDVRAVRAMFGIEQLENCSRFAFIDSSENALSYFWELGMGQVSTEQNPQMDYGTTTGTFNVCLYVQSPEGCLDTFCKELSTEYSEEAYIYNVFTPGTDHYNDRYVVDIKNPGEFELKIFNRWGELVFRSTDPGEGWDGRMLNQGAELPSGTYFYQLRYAFSCSDEVHESHGTVDLIR